MLNLCHFFQEQKPRLPRYYGPFFSYYIILRSKGKFKQRLMKLQGLAEELAQVGIQKLRVLIFEVKIWLQNTFNLTILIIRENRIRHLLQKKNNCPHFPAIFVIGFVMAKSEGIYLSICVTNGEQYFRNFFKKRWVQAFIT